MIPSSVDFSRIFAPIHEKSTGSRFFIDDYPGASHGPRTLRSRYKGPIQGMAIHAQREIGVNFQPTIDLTGEGLVLSPIRGVKSTRPIRSCPFRRSRAVSGWRRLAHRRHKRRGA
ncbi:MAG: hypothetical protein WD969_05620, partial [Paracoccaceae bacterium]